MALHRVLSACLPAIDSRPMQQIEQEIVDELDFHLAMRTEENMSQGMSLATARGAALTRFGDFATIQKRCRRALLGDRIMWQRVQLLLSLGLLAAVAVLALKLYSGQRANEAALADITSALKQLAPPPAQGDAPKAEVADPMKPYPITLSADRVREFPTLAVAFGKLKLSGERVLVVPISTDAGVTGAVLLGNGTYSYAPESGKVFEGHFHAAMLRFNPKDAELILKLTEGSAVVDKGASELAKTVLATTIDRCYQSNHDALIPPAGVIAADLFSRELGEVLFSGDESTAIVYDFTSRKSLYEKN